MIRVWFDSIASALLIDGLAPFPARSLIATALDTRIRLDARSGFRVANLNWDKIADVNGVGFGNGVDALAYIQGELLKGPRDEAPIQINASNAATWILPNPLGRAPMVQVFIAPGELVIADVIADPAWITVTFPAPQQGFVLAK